MIQLDENQATEKLGLSVLEVNIESNSDIKHNTANGYWNTADR